MTRQLGRALGGVLALAVWGTVPSWTASPPPVINFQGVLRDASGQPITGTRDLTFRFFLSPGGTDDVLSDRHQSLGSGGVAVTNGLFSVLLGGGTVTDGSMPGTYTSLSAVFGDFPEVWMEILVEADPPMQPRIRIAASAYAHNADHLDGLDALQMLRSDASSSLSAGTLTIDPGATLDVNGTLALNGILELKSGGPDGFQQIAFFEDGLSDGEQLVWSDTGDAFVFSDELGIQGGLTVGSGVVHPYACFADTPAGCAPGSALISAPGDVMVGQDLEVAGVLTLAGSIYLDRNGPEGDQNLYFFNNGNPAAERIGFDDGPDRFLVTAGLDIQGGSFTADGGISTTGALSGASLSGSSLTVTGATRLGSSTQGSTHTATVENTGSVQALRLIGPGATFGYQARLNFGDADYAYIDEPTDDELRIVGSGGVGINGAPTQGAGSLQVFGNTVVNGNLSATGTKPFVQNHPHDRDLSVVYVALEGDEAGTYTRGSGRLHGGEARVQLGETFAWVTNPDVGLTAQLTPRGEWADLYLASLGTTEMVVRARDGASEVAFDYLVQGLRIGYERFPIVQARTVDARIPSDLYYEVNDPGRPATGGHTALARFTAGTTSGSDHDLDPGAAAVREGGGARPSAANLDLRRGIGEFDEHPYARRLTAQDGKVLAAPSPGQPGVQAAVDPSRAAALARSAPEPPAGAPVSAAVPLPAPRPVPVDADGNVYARSFRPSARDLASFVPVSGRVEPGDVLSIDPDLPGVMTLAREPGDARVFGIVAEAPGVVLGSPGPEGATTRDAAVAFSGVALCKVDADLGAIRAGDLLVTSSTPGHAMRSDNPRPGTILGKALEPLESGTGLISVLVILR